MPPDRRASAIAQPRERMGFVSIAGTSQPWRDAIVTDKALTSQSVRRTLAVALWVLARIDRIVAVLVSPEWRKNV
jgi:hypothetical protein